jgi:hypothetical protein
MIDVWWLIAPGFETPLAHEVESSYHLQFLS